MKTLLVLNGPPCGDERSYNALRVAGSLVKREGEQVRVFLIGDAAACAKRNQKVSSGYYNLEVMLGSVARRGGSVGVCGSYMDARGINQEDLAEGAHRSSMDELTDWTLWADKALVF